MTDLPVRDARRRRIAEVMREHYLCTNRDEADADGNMPCRCGDWREPGAEADNENDWDSHLADAVLDALPELTAQTADRAAILREAISAAEDEARHLYDDMGQKAAAGARLVADRLRRMADETQPTTEPEPGCTHCGKTIRRITGTLTEWWVHIPGGQALCYPWQPARSTRATPKAAAGARQDGVQQ